LELQRTKFKIGELDVSIRSLARGSVLIDCVHGTRDVDEIVPGHVSEGEIVVDHDHLMEAGYVGKPPDFHLRIGNFLIYRQPVFYRDYWLRFEMPRQGRPNLYSIFKERQQK
jgi:hypothetical protein